AVSGGGPAYVFLLIECLAEAATQMGLAPDLAMKLARETVTGSGELAHLSKESAAALRQAVMSPKGTTLEAINYFAPLGIELNGNLQVKVMVLIDRNGQPQVLPDTAQLVQGQISRSKAGQLADRIISGWRFTPTQMAGEPVMQEYWVQLQVRALGR
ncbi:MAG: hypothetical protein HC838_09035, partial [Spirulinaceae cyanobacterium RM2_2_10]|nr:hypothetical protein [Spirulinaceae cyanobacterium RM2_2_10]